MRTVISRAQAVALIRGWRIDVAVAWLLVVAVGQQFAPDNLTLPELTSYEPVAAPAAAIFALPVALVALVTTREPVTQLPATAAVRLRAVRLGRMLLITAVAVAAVSWSAHPLPGLVAVLALLGEGLLGAAVFGSRLTWFLPATHAMTAATIGARYAGDPHTWAWIISARPDPSQVAASAGLYVLGLLVWALRPDRW